jgi:hypothetical protein
MLNNIKLNAGAYTELAITGRFINIVLAAGEIQARMRLKNGSTFQTKLVSGMSFELPEGFVSAAFLSETGQQTKIWLSNLPLTYSPLESRIVGASGLASSSAKVLYGAAKMIKPATVGRAKLTVFAPDDIYVGGVGLTAASAVKVSAGTTRDFSTQSALFGYTDKSIYQGKEIAKPMVVNDMPLAKTIDNYWKGQVHYSTERDYLYIGYENGYRVVDAKTYELIRWHGFANVRKAPVEYSATRYWSEFNGRLYTVVSCAYDTVLIEIDMELDSHKNIMLWDDGINDVQDYFLDFNNNQSAVILDQKKLITGNMENAIEVTPPANMVSDTLRAVVILGGELYLYSRHYQVKSADMGLTWGTVTGLPFSLVSWGGIQLDEITGLFYGCDQWEIYTSLNGVNWVHSYDHAHSKNIYDIFVAGGYFYGVGEKYLVTSIDAGKTWHEQDLDILGIGTTGSMCVTAASNGRVYISNAETGLHVFSGEAVTVGGLDIAIMEEIN